MAFASLPPTVNTSKKQVPVPPGARRTAQPTCSETSRGNSASAPASRSQTRRCAGDPERRRDPLTAEALERLREPVGPGNKKMVTKDWLAALTGCGKSLC